MGQILPGSARTTQAIRRALQRSQESVQSLAQRQGIHPKTVAKWRQRTTTPHAARGPKPASTGRSPEEEAAAGAFRQHTHLPLDDGLYALQATIPRLTRSALHRLLQRHGIRRLPLTEEGQSRAKKKFNAYPIGSLPVDVAQVQTQQGRVYLFVAVDRTSKVALAAWQPRACGRQNCCVGGCRPCPTKPIRCALLLAYSSPCRRTSGLPVGTALSASAARLAGSTAAPSRRTRGPTARSNAGTAP